MKALQIILIACLMLVSGCYTKRKAARQVTRAQATFPAVVAEGCGSWYPPRIATTTNTQYKQGKDSIVHDTIPVKCPDDAAGNPQTVYVPVPRYKTRVDTFFSEKVIEKENTAQVKALTAQIKTVDNWRTAAIICGALFIIQLLLTFKKT